MIRISQIKLPFDHSEADLRRAIEKCLKGQTILSYQIVKQSIDSREKYSMGYQYSVDVQIRGREDRVIKSLHNKKVTLVERQHYEFPWKTLHRPETPPVIVGTGPAGLFCGLLLARAGLCPVLIERGQSVGKRTETVETFWKTGQLHPSSNVQFGEGGAGTFSDGKLNTLVKDKFLRNRKVLEEFAAHGAPEEILWLAKPHIGTDRLIHVVKSIREEILSLGGSVLFESQVTDLQIQDGALRGLLLADGESIPASHVVLAIGHSARDTFEMLCKRGLSMEKKAFAIGIRMEHLREDINDSQYHVDWRAYQLPTASYKVTHQASNGRGIYSFCMCPGGYVVNASSEPGRLAINGMSNYDRMEDNSNTALVVTVTPEDYGGEGPLAGVEFQRKLEESAYRLCDGRIPVQRYEDFKQNRTTEAFGRIHPCMKGDYDFANLRDCLPPYVTEAILEGVEAFGRKIKGYDHPDSLLSAIESRTSSPVRICRDEHLESNIKGIFPCGEGAGYAGGITSAAMDGIRIAEEIAKRLIGEQDNEK